MGQKATWDRAAADRHTAAHRFVELSQRPLTRRLTFGPYAHSIHVTIVKFNNRFSKNSRTRDRSTGVQF
jgi:hypothetical protein